MKKILYLLLPLLLVGCYWNNNSFMVVKCENGIMDTVYVKDVMSYNFNEYYKVVTFYDLHYNNAMTCTNVEKIVRVED